MSEGAGAGEGPPWRQRWATPADAETIAAYHHRCWLDAFADLVDGDVTELDPLGKLDRWRAWLSDESPERTAVIDVAGAAVAHVTVRGSELVHLFVDPDHQRSGFGRVLLRTGERILAMAGVTDAVLHTMVGNEPAVELYRSAGWTVTDRLHHEDAGSVRYDEHVLVKALSPVGHVEANREHWDDDAHNWVERGRRAWAGEPRWGEVGTPESELDLLDGVAGADVVELGCGTGYISAWCARAGAASVVGLDNSLGQLRSARVLQAEFDLTFPLVWADAERSPLADDSFDLAISEYGAAIWCDPDRWIPEAARILRPGGRLVFLGTSALLALCYGDFEHDPTFTALQRPQRAMRRFAWPDDDCVEFHVSHGDMVKTLTRSGFVIDDLIELYVPESDARADAHFERAWGRDWPAEEIWVAHLG